LDPLVSGHRPEAGGRHGRESLCEASRAVFGEGGEGVVAALGADFEGRRPGATR